MYSSPSGSPSPRSPSASTSWRPARWTMCYSRQPQPSWRPREWILLEKTSIESLRAFLLTYVLQRPNLQKYVREQILLAVAVIVKRGSLDKSINCKGIFHEVGQLISSGNPTVQTLACSILTALLSEFSSSSKTSSIGLSMEFHGNCKRLFQEDGLRQTFMLTMEVLQEFSRRENLNAQMSCVFQRYLALANQVLSWNFLPPNLGRHYIAMFEATQNVTLKPTESWREALLDTRVMDLFFSLPPSDSSSLPPNARS
ncbi:exportin-4-like [Gambusia affinis]|uniref:exportin-4-like n=1 Tax=Gambusia affinis TaxID=33528 RepID=UPI001CDC4645|nr:exportin-4-like [Gambusia affinis]